MLTLHALEHSRSLRIVWLLEELGVPYALQQHRRDAKTRLAPAALRAVHPLGKAPVLDDGGLVLAESGAIVDYLVTTYGQGAWQPTRPSAEHWQYQRWLHYAEGSVMPLAVFALVLHRMQNMPMPFFVKPIARRIAEGLRGGFILPQAQLHLGHVNEHLSTRTWFMGDQISGADIMMSFPLQAAMSRLVDGSKLPAIAAWLARVEARPAYQRAVAKAGQPLMPM